MRCQTTCLKRFRMQCDVKRIHGRNNHTGVRHLSCVASVASDNPRDLRSHALSEPKSRDQNGLMSFAILHR